MIKFHPPPKKKNVLKPGLNSISNNLYLTDRLIKADNVQQGS